MLFTVEERAIGLFMANMVTGIDPNEGIRDPDRPDDPKPALKFEILLTKEIEKALQGVGVGVDASKVADMQLAFNNADLLRLLE